MSEKLQELVKLKSGGAYVPPAKLKALMAEVELDKNSEISQQLEWDILNKKINSIINRVNKGNIRDMVVSLFKLNLIRGKGLLCNNLIKSQMLSTAYTDVYSSLVCVINSKLPEIGDLLIKRLLTRYKRFYRREDLDGCTSIIIFLCELVLFKVCSEKLLIELVDQLLESPNDFKVQITVIIIRKCGYVLFYEEETWFDKVRNILRNVLNESIVGPKSQFLIHKLFNDMKMITETENAIDDDLDLVDEEEYIMHKISIHEGLSVQSSLDIFAVDPDYQENNEKYDIIRHDILGSDIESDEEELNDDTQAGSNDDKNSDFSSDNEVEQDDEDDFDKQLEVKHTVEIKDFTEQELTNYQKNVYLTVMSSMSPEEATHKLLKLPAIDETRKEYMLIDMIIKCCAQEKVYSKFYGQIGESLVTINPKWASQFQFVFKENYENCYKYETSLLRNLGQFWGHMFACDKMGWQCLSVVKLTEQDTTSSGRIFIKYIFQRMVEETGIKYVKERIGDSFVEESLQGIFPTGDAEHLRFSINYFTAIELGELTDKMREDLKNMPIEGGSIEDEAGFIGGADYSDSGSDSDNSRGRSPSPERGREPGRLYNSQQDEGNRDRSYSRSRSNSRERSRSRSPVRGDLRNIPTGPRGARGGRGGGYGRGGRGRGNRGAYGGGDRRSYDRDGYDRNNYDRGNYDRSGRGRGGGYSRGRGGRGRGGYDFYDRRGPPRD